MNWYFVCCYFFVGFCVKYISKDTFKNELDGINIKNRQGTCTYFAIKNVNEKRKVIFISEKF